LCPASISCKCSESKIITGDQPQTRHWDRIALEP
jgi:hypothetical protein